MILYKRNYSIFFARKFNQLNKNHIEYKENCMNEFNSTTNRWFSENPDRAWTEKFYLLYIPVWILLMVIANVLDKDFLFKSDIILIPFSLAIALPYLLVPAILRRKQNPDGHWYESYWFKAFLFIFIFQLLGNYFICEYFFDVLGMVYYFPNLKVTFDSALVGTGIQTVPLIMYPLTMATYMTYHTTAIIVLRRTMTSPLGANRWLRWPVFIVFLLALAYFWAWTETQSFANSAIERNFHYLNKETMLAYGSIVFGLSFIPSFTIFYFLDEKEHSRWSLVKVCAAALSAAMIALFLTDICTRIIGTIPM